MRRYKLVVASTLLMSLVMSSAITVQAWEQTNGPFGGIIETIEVSPDNPNIVYAGGKGGGLYKSIDSGSSWKPLKRIVHPSEHITDILISSVNSEVIFSRIANGLLYKSVDGGLNWRALDKSIGATCIAISKQGVEIIAAGTSDGRIFTSNDSGENWSEISGNLPTGYIHKIEFGKENELWVSLINVEIGTPIGHDGNLFRTIDNGTSWSIVDVNQPDDSYISAILVDQENRDVIFVGLGPAVVWSSNNIDNFFLKSIDGGLSWRSISLPSFHQSTISSIHKDYYRGMLYATEGGFLYRSKDNGISWTFLRPPGQSGDVTDLASTESDNSILFFPRKSHGIFLSKDGGDSWIESNQGLFNVSVSILSVSNAPGDGTIYASALSGEGTFKTSDFGQNWQYLNDGGITHPWTDEVRISPHDDDTVWEVADVGEVFVTTDGGESWFKTIDASHDGFRFGSVYAIATAQSDPNVLYALKNGFGIFKSEDKGFTWTFLRQSEIDYSYSLAVQPNNPDIIYSGYNPKPFQKWAMVRQSTDGGVSWRTSLKVDDASGVTSVAIDPNAPSRVYAGSTGRGGTIWVSDNTGDDWSKLNEHLSFANIHVLTVDPSESETAYAGVWGGGTFKTEDGAKSWSRVKNDPTISASAIIVHPNNPQELYIADRTSPKIYRTKNSGTTWDVYFDAGQEYYRILSAAISPGNPDVIYTSVFKRGGPMIGDVFKINRGSSTIVTGSLEKLPVFLAVDPTDDDLVYAVLHGYGVFKTNNGGSNWTDISGPSSGLPQSPIVGFNSLTIDPNNPTNLYLAGGCDIDLDLSHSGAEPDHMNTIYKSTDGGMTWRNLNDGNFGTRSNSIKSVAVSPLNSNVLFASALSGIYMSRNAGASWDMISSDLPYSHMAGLAISDDATHVYVPTLGGGVFVGSVGQTDHTVTWSTDNHLIVDIHHIQLVVDPIDSKTLYASAYPGGLFKTTDNGDSWQECNFGMASFHVDDPSRQGYYAFAVSPSDTNVLYMGLYGIGVYKSDDAATTWKPVNGTLHTMRGKTITSLVVDPNSENIIYVATEDGIFISEDGGTSWIEFNAGLDCKDIRVISINNEGNLLAGSRGYELYSYDFEEYNWQQMNAFGNFGTYWPIWNNRPLYQYTSLLFHPTDPDIIYFGTFPAGIYQSTDGGISWKEKNVNWTNDGVFTLAPHPDNPSIVYAGTYNGVNRSSDNGVHWQPWDIGWPVEQWVFSIDFDPLNPDVMYACSKNGVNEGTGTDGFRGTVMKSVNGGLNWFPITDGLDLSQEFYAIIVDKYDSNVLYLSTQREGVFISYNGGESWKAWNAGLTNLIAGTNGNNVTNPLVMTADGLYLFFGTDGSGVFRQPTVTNIGPKINLYVNSQDFGQVNLEDSPQSQLITITNLGQSDLVIDSARMWGTNESDFVIANDYCSENKLLPFAQCTLEVSFAPSSPGKKEAAIAIVSNDDSNPNIDLPLYGELIESPGDVNDGDYSHWSVSGSVKYDDNPVCAMVLINGQYMFSCKSGDEFGKYDLEVPSDNDGKITAQVFVSGLAPFRKDVNPMSITSDPPNIILDIEMQNSSPDSKTMAVTKLTSTDKTVPAGWTYISGTVEYGGDPICAMVLANGQYMFSCGDNSGIYDLTVPLDSNGQITLYVFASGFQPYRHVFAP